ncbi:MAG: hypothetical protein ACRCZF_25410, partial [Gemmataceae bacterium]
TTADRVREELEDETSTRTDLAFISGGSLDDDRFFSPERSITLNAHSFVADLDVVSIINCTNLFTNEACLQIDFDWRKFGVITDSI